MQDLMRSVPAWIEANIIVIKNKLGLSPTKKGFLQLHVYDAI